MWHFSLLLFYAAAAGVVFGAIGREGVRAQVTYGLKVFIEFVAVGMILAWVMYLVT
jgi:hypothetical protein